MSCVIETDNFGRDYPNEKFVGVGLTPEAAVALADKLNAEEGGDYSSSYYRVVADDYKLAPGFEP